MKNPLHVPQILTVKSSAGSGKTYSLALRYLTLLIHEAITHPSAKNSIARIVAITFTNKAAAEMRSRIIEWMKRSILDIPFPNNTHKPVDLIVEAGNDTIQRTRAVEEIQKNLEALLKHFYDFKVSTIDSFVNLIVKASAFKLNLPPDFDISTDSSFYIDLVVKELLQRILEEKNIRKTFDRFLQNYIEIEGTNVTWIPTKFLKEIMYMFWQEEAKENRTFTQTRRRISIRRIRDRIEQDVRSLFHYLTTTPGIDVDRKFLRVLEQFQSLKGIDGTAHNYFQRKHLHELLNKKSAPVDKAFEILWQRIRASLSQLVNSTAESRFSSYIDIYTLFKQMLWKEITSAKRLVLIEQLNALLQQIIGDAEFVPEIYYALAEQYTHFLIDEFQDTNRLQWKNVELLVDEALSRGGTLFLVGDKKQAIYRWRGGHPELIDEIVTRYAAYPQSVLRLDTNYRSGEHIVYFNNTVFHGDNLQNLIRGALDEAKPHEVERIIEIYSDTEQLYMDSSAGKGYVYVEKLTRHTQKGKDTDHLLRDEEYDMVKQRFITLVDEIRQRNVFEDRDIAVLVRRRDEANFIVKALLERGIGVESEFTVNIKNHPLIREILSFLQFINTPHNNLSFASFITGTIFRKNTLFSEQDISEWITTYRIDNPRAPLYKLFETSFPHVWERYFEFFFKRAGYLPLYDFVVLFFKQWNLFQYFPEDGPYFLHLSELIATREASEENNLSSFLRFWNESSGGTFDVTETERPFLLKTTEGANAIKVLTIHKAKGLQFPVVILPFLKFTSFGSTAMRNKTTFIVPDREQLKLFYIKKNFCSYSELLDSLYRQKEQQFIVDELNALYVACTRAENELYILLSSSKKQKNLFADYLFKLGSVKPFTHDTTIIMGNKTREREKHPVGIQYRIYDFPETALGGTALWTEKIKAKLQHPDTSSYKHVIAKRQGDIIHYILSLIKRLPDDYEPTIKQKTADVIRLFGFNSLQIPIQKLLLRFFEDETCKKFFQPEEDAIIFTEKEIIDTHGHLHKVDRMIIHNDWIDVIDFKTGEPYEKSHEEQIVRYASLIAQIHPDKNIQRYLVYIENQKVEKV